MLIQTIILIYILFSFYSLSYWISNIFRRKGVSEKIAFKLFVPLLFSLYTFYVLIAFGGNSFLMSLIPLILFSESYVILPAVLLIFVSPILSVLVLPYLFYTFRSFGRKFTYIKPTKVSFLIPIISIISIGFGSYLIYLFPLSLVTFLIASIFVPVIDLKFEKINVSNVVLFSLAFMLPIASVLKKITFDRNLLIVTAIISLIPLVRSLYVYSRREYKNKF